MRYDKVIASGILVATMAAGIIFRVQMPDCGIVRIKTIDDVPERQVVLKYAWGEQDESALTSSVFRDEFLGENNYMDTATDIVIAEPTGNIQQNNTDIRQEIRIKEVLSGTVDAGEICHIYQYFGFRETGGEIEFLKVQNLMYPGNEYLVFMNESPLNAYQKEKAFTLVSENMGYIRIGPQTTKTLDADYQKYDFTELKDYDFFSVSKPVVDSVNDIRTEILEKYLGGAYVCKGSTWGFSE